MTDSDLTERPEGRSDAGTAAASMLGHRIRTVRQKADRTLDDLSRATGLHKAYLSRVERGQKSPSLSALLRIAKALGVEVGGLLGETVDSGAISVVRRSERRPMPAPQGLHAWSALFTGEGPNSMSAFVVEPDTTVSRETAGHPGEELVVVLSGAVEVMFQDRTVFLETGDVCRFEGHLGHRIRGIGAAKVEVLVVVVSKEGSPWHPGGQDEDDTP